MAINATNSGAKRELIPAGNYMARCYQMIHIGTVEENILGELKTLNKVRIRWELPTEMRVFKPENGEQPCAISKSYTLSLNEKANLRKMLASWRGKDFTEDEAKKFDISKLIGVPCMLNLIHKPSKDGTKVYEEIGSISPMPKGVVCPDGINPQSVLDYENWSWDIFNKQPDFIKAMIESSVEFKAMTNIPVDIANDNDTHGENETDLPF